MSDTGATGTGATGDQGTSDSGTDPGTGTVTGGTDAGAGDSGTQTLSLEDLQKDNEKWKALARKHETRSKENASAVTELQKLKDKDKTELQLAQERATAAEAKALAAQSEHHRVLAAASHDLGPDFVGFLGDGDEDTINSRAETLSKNIQAEVDSRVKAELAKYGIQMGQSGTAPTAAAAASLSLGRRPIESLRPGSAPAGGSQPANKNDMFRGMLGQR